MFDCRFYAFYPVTAQWYRLVQDEEGRVAYLKVGESEIRKADFRFVVPEYSGMIGIVPST